MATETCLVRSRLVAVSAPFLPLETNPGVLSRQAVSLLRYGALDLKAFAPSFGIDGKSNTVARAQTTEEMRKTLPPWNGADGLHGGEADRISWERNPRGRGWELLFPAYPVEAMGRAGG